MSIYSINMHVTADSIEEAKAKVNKALDYSVHRHTHKAKGRHIIIEDTLPDIMLRAKNALDDAFLAWLPSDWDSFDDFDSTVWLDGLVMEIAEKHAPVCDHEIGAICFLYKREINDRCWEEYAVPFDHDDPVHGIRAYIMHELKVYKHIKIRRRFNQYLEWSKKKRRTGEEHCDYVKGMRNVKR